MYKLIYSIIALALSVEVFASAPNFTKYPQGTIISKGKYDLVGILSLVQSLLLKVVLPIVIIGGSLYIAYELFTAEGDETKMKKAWKAFTFTAIGLVCIAVSYAFVSVTASLSI